MRTENRIHSHRVRLRLREYNAPAYAVRGSCARPAGRRSRVCLHASHVTDAHATADTVERPPHYTSGDGVISSAVSSSARRPQPQLQRARQHVNAAAGARVMHVAIFLLPAAHVLTVLQAPVQRRCAQYRHRPCELSVGCRAPTGGRARRSPPSRSRRRREQRARFSLRAAGGLCTHAVAITPREGAGGLSVLRSARLFCARLDRLV